MKKTDNCKVIAAVVIVLVFIVVPILGGVFFGSRHSTHTPYWEKDLSPELVDKVEACHKKGMAAGRLTNGWDVTDIKCYED